LHFTVTTEGEVAEAAVTGDAGSDLDGCRHGVMACRRFQPPTAAVQLKDPLHFVRARPAPPAL
jgi:hypothetical protein